MYAQSVKQRSVSKVLKRLRIGKFAINALLIIAFAVCLRILLTLLGWPTTNADEGTMGIMARHIAYNGEHPILYYGQSYMGTIEAYLGAAFFRLFGASLFTLRLGVILLDALFLASMYLLTSVLYTKKMALFVLALLGLGPNAAILLWELYAKGGSTQTLFFGALAFLLASWLALTSRKAIPRGSGKRWLRFAAYSGWGLAVGLGIWSDLIVLPFLMMSGLLLLLVCWQEARSWAPVFLLLGFFIGVFPLIAYNLHAPPGQDSLSTFLGNFKELHAQSSHASSHLLLGIQETIRMSLPTATGDPFCPVSAVDYALDASPGSAHCTMLHTSWSEGYLLLWLLAVVLAGRRLWTIRARMKGASPEETHEMIRQVARLCLLGSAALAMAAYVVSAAPQTMPHSHARYLLGLLIVTPALIWPLWSGASAVNTRWWGQALTTRGALVLIALLFLLGTLRIVNDIPSSQRANQQQDAFIAYLMHIGATHIYTDYWTCYRIVFVSQEHILCSVTDRSLKPAFNRYEHYHTVVQADSHAAYVFTYDIFQKGTTLKKADLSGHGFRRFIFGDYILYQPK